jgi:5-methylcytosine-specific restriction endonuclease McrA
MISALWRGVVAFVRSGKWKAVRAHHLEKEPVCQVCSRDAELEVHHCLPIHAGGSETDPENLITMCHECHYCVAHACNWRCWRAEIKEIAKYLREKEVRRV